MAAESGARRILPARTGVAVPLKEDQTIKVINTHGTQVVDFWALVPSVLSPSIIAEYASMSHTRASTLHLSPAVHDLLLTNQRQAVLELVEDTSPGIHDTLIAACDAARYRQLGVTAWHASCAENFQRALEAIALHWPGMVAGSEHGVPDPLNLFMNIPVSPDARLPVAGLSWDSPVSKAGDYVVFRAVRDCVVVMSACPQDLVKVNSMQPTSVEYEVNDL